MSTDRPATTDPAEVAPVHTGGNAEDCPACDGRSDLPYPWICPGKDLTASGREFAVRASEAPRTAEEEDHAFLARAGGGPDPEPFRAEPKRPRRCAPEAPGDAHSPAPDVGAARGGEGGSAAESEPRATVKRRILEALDRWHEVGGDTTGEFAGVMEAVDDYATAIRAQVADEITAHFTQERAQVADAEPVTLGGVHEQAKLLGRYDRVIATIDRIARGDQ